MRRRFDRVVLFLPASSTDTPALANWLVDTDLIDHLPDIVFLDAPDVPEGCRRLQVEVFVAGGRASLADLAGVVDQRWLLAKSADLGEPGVDLVPSWTDALMRVWPALRPGLVDGLGSSDRGLYLITTRGSGHLWDAREDGSIWWKRRPGVDAPQFSEDTSGWIRLTRVEHWPRRGARALLWFDSQDGMVEEWRYISLINKIEMVNSVNGHATT